jgi:hypothetical protein
MRDESRLQTLLPFILHPFFRDNLPLEPLLADRLQDLLGGELLGVVLNYEPVLREIDVQRRDTRKP